MKRKSLRQAKIESAARFLMQADSLENAVEFREVCLYAIVSEQEAWAAMRHLEATGFKIGITNTFPRKFYVIHE